MSSVLQVAHSVSPAAAGLLLASIWQGILLTAGVGLVLQLLRPISSTARALVWTAVLVLVLVLPILGVEGTHALPTAHPELHVASDWSILLLTLWVGASILRAGRLSLQAFRLWRLAGRATPVPVEGALAALLNGSRSAELCVSGEVDRPSVVGFLRPRILLPEGLIETLLPAELEHVVLHEMEHLRRYDDWLNLLQQVSLVLLPLNPALVWLDRHLCRERELACDDGVLAATRARKAYAACLVKLAEDSMVRRGVTLALSALGTRAKQSELVRRVRRILAGPEAGVTGHGTTRLAVGGLTVAIAFGAVLLSRSPQLVSFDAKAPETSQVAQANPAASVASGPVLRPVTELPAANGTGRPLLAKAVLTGPSLSSPSMMQRTAVPTLARRKLKNHSVTPPRAVMLASPERKVAYGKPGMVTAGHVVMTEFEVSQPVYAAVPWQDGWLIVQL